MSTPADSVASRTPAQWLGAVRDAERRGELLTAVDLAERGLAEHPGDVSLEHRAVLALARAGSTEEAARRFADYRLALVDDEDVAALGARLEKDFALATDGDGRAEHAARAAATDHVGRMGLPGRATTLRRSVAHMHRSSCELTVRRARNAPRHSAMQPSDGAGAARAASWLECDGGAFGEADAADRRERDRDR